VISLGIDGPPTRQHKPHTPGFEPPLIPRLTLGWYQKDAKHRFLSNADIEINMETGEITYVGWSHRNMLGDAPSIDVPIRLPGRGDQVQQEASGPE